MTVFSRAKGHSAVAAAAYRAGTKIKDERTGVVHNYTRRGGVASVNVFAPAGAPSWVDDPERLFNAAEASETRINSRTARELLVALPVELDADQRQALALSIARELVERYGVAVMAAVHAPSAEGDQRNHHAHLLFTTRTVGPDGFGGKVRVLDDQKTGPEEVEHLRGRVAKLTNEHLARAGIAEQVDHRRLDVQARAAEEVGNYTKAVLLTRTPVITEGKAVTAARRRGEQTRVARWNESVRRDNRSLLENVLAKAQADGRLMETPAGGRQQARSDRERAEHAARTSAGEVRSRGGYVSSARRKARISRRGGVSSDVDRHGSAAGPGAKVLNVQSMRWRLQRREEEAGGAPVDSDARSRNRPHRAESAKDRCGLPHGRPVFPKGRTGAGDALRA